MARTLPSIMTDYARDARAIFAYVLEIEPSAADSWTTKRFCTNSVEIEGDEFDEAIATNISRIVQKADIIQTGNIAVFPDVEIGIINKDDLHSELITDNILNRKATIKMSVISPNKILNSSFEKRTADDFEDWTEYPAVDGSISAYTADKYDGSTSVRMVGGSATMSLLFSGPMIWKVGEELIFSAYGKNINVGSTDLKIAFRLNSSVYWNPATQDWQVGFASFSIGSIDNTQWTRLSYSLGWKELYFDELLAYPSSGYVSVEIILVAEAGEDILVDSVQLEAGVLSPYHHNRFELTDDDVFTAFTGRIKRPKWNHSRMTFQLESYQSNQHQQIPLPISEDDVSGWVVPSRSVGKPYPMTYGDFMESRPWNQQEAPAMARGILANSSSTPTDGIVVFFDRLALYDDGSSIYRLFHYHENQSSYYEQMDYDHASYSYDDQEFLDDLSSNGKFKESSNPQFITAGAMPLMVHLRGRIARNPVDFVDYENVRDGLLASYTYCISTGDPAGHFGLEIEPCPFETKDVMLDTNLGGRGLAIFLLGDFYITPDIVSGWITLRAGVGALSGWGSYSNAVDTIFYQEAGEAGWSNVPAERSGSPNKNLTQICVQPSGTDDEVPQRFKIAVTMYTEAGTANHQLNVYEVGVLVYVTQSIEKMNFAAQLYGRIFGGTWDSRKTAANMVESPSEVIESIIREELGGVNADIDMTRFDAADSARSSYKCAGQLHDFMKSKDVFQKICQEFGAIYFIDVFGKHSLLALDYDSQDHILTPGDFSNGYNGIQASYTPRESVINDVRVLYKKNQFTDEYQKVAYCNKDGYSGSIGSAYQTKCSDSYAAVGNESMKFDIQCDWIRDDATAELLVKWLIDWNYLQRIIIEGDIFFRDLSIEVGDMIRLFSFEKVIPDSITTDALFIVTETRTKRSEGRIGVVLLEVKEP